MNTRYCARQGCGAANPYTSTKPRFCCGCGQPFDAAFASTPAPASATQPVYVPAYVHPAPAPLARPTHPAARPRPERVFQSVRDQRRTPAQAASDYADQEADQERFDDAPADRDAAYAEGMEIAAQLDPAAFGIGTAPKVTFRFGELPNLREAASKMAGEGDPAPKKRAARAKKGAA